MALKPDADIEPGIGDALFLAAARSGAPADRLRADLLDDDRRVRV